MVESDVGYPLLERGAITQASANQFALHLPSFLPRCVQIFHRVSAIIRRWAQTRWYTQEVGAGDAYVQKEHRLRGLDAFLSNGRCARACRLLISIVRSHLRATLMESELCPRYLS